MKYIRKIVASGLIGVLAAFVGGFCLHPMTAQAMETAPTMVGSASPVLESEQMMDDGADTYLGNERPGTLSNLCVLACASKTPQAVAAKKFSVDWEANFFLHVSAVQAPLAAASSAGPAGPLNARPPAPDILSSVFKKE